LKLHAHFLAEAVNFAQDSTFTVFKGGITQVTTSQPPSSVAPALVRFMVLTRLEFSIEEAASGLHQLQMSITLPDGSQHTGPLQPIAVKVADISLGRVYANVLTNMNIVVASPGDIIVAGLIDGDALPLLYLQVKGAAG
jgi:hypothetical protein